MDTRAGNLGIIARVIDLISYCMMSGSTAEVCLHTYVRIKDPEVWRKLWLKVLSILIYFAVSRHAHLLVSKGMVLI